MRKPGWPLVVHLKYELPWPFFLGACNFAIYKKFLTCYFSRNRVLLPLIDPDEIGIENSRTFRSQAYLPAQVGKQPRGALLKNPAPSFFIWLHLTGQFIRSSFRNK